jgi:hypothetical protein
LYYVIMDFVGMIKLSAAWMLACAALASIRTANSAVVGGPAASLMPLTAVVCVREPAAV